MLAENLALPLALQCVVWRLSTMHAASVSLVALADRQSPPALPVSLTLCQWHSYIDSHQGSAPRHCLHSHWHWQSSVLELFLT
jgi:hypothetical protein